MRHKKQRKKGKIVFNYRISYYIFGNPKRTHEKTSMKNNCITKYKISIKFIYTNNNQNIIKGRTLIIVEK